MDVFTLDFSKYYDDIILALKEVFGYEYGDIIEERFKSIYITTYANKSGIINYYWFLESIKSKELCIKFLNRIGIDTSKYNITSYADDFTGELETYIDGYLNGQNAFKCQLLPDSFRAFNQEKAKDSNVTDTQIKFINFIRKNREPITEETYDEFKKTSEYEEILTIAQRYNEIYDELAVEMNAYLESIKIYKDYNKSENERYKKILESAALTLYSRIAYQLPDEILDVLNKCDTFENIISKFFGTTIDSKLYLEYFSVEDELKLNSPNTSDYDKKWIMYYRKKYFQNMGLDIDAWNDDYHEIMKREDAQKLIPPQDVIMQIEDGKTVQLQMANFKFVRENDTFIRASKKFGETDHNKNLLYNIMKDPQVCITGGSSPTKTFIPLMFLTMRGYQCGIMDYIVLHEIIHAIEAEKIFNTTIKGDFRCGFEPCIYGSKVSLYPHAKTRRKYERFNETMTDMFALEARGVLHKKGIYFMEPKEHTKTYEGDHNTSKLLKEMLKPFLDNYRPLIINARILGTMDRLKYRIGEENFEELNDIIDFVDSLVEKGLEVKTTQNINDDPLVIEFKKQIQRLAKVYASMAECYSRTARNEASEKYYYNEYDLLGNKVK